MNKRLTDERKRAAETGEASAWTAMVAIYILPAVATIDALCRLRVTEAEEEWRLPRDAGIVAEREACAAEVRTLRDAAMSGTDERISLAAGVIAITSRK